MRRTENRIDIEKKGLCKCGDLFSYYVDKETGICLGYESGMSAAGFDLGADSDVFRCTEFVTENVASLRAMVE